MNLIQINNLKKLVVAGYPHICLTHSNLSQLIVVPAMEKIWYPFKGREFFNKKGFFNGGKTTVWSTYDFKNPLKDNHIMIAERLPHDGGHAGWSEAFSFEEEGSVETIERMMKLKAFW